MAPFPTLTPIPGASRAYLANEWGYQAAIAMQRNGALAVQKTLVTGAKSHWLKKLDRIFKEDSLATQRAAAHGRVAEAMSQATLAKVQAINGKDYRKGKGRLPGALAKAVSHPSFAYGDQYGVKFIDRDMMAREAAHWQRINFGTGSLQEPAVVVKPKMGGRQLMDVTVKPIAVGGGQALPNPVIPDGWFWHGSVSIRKSREYSGRRTGNPFFPDPSLDGNPTATTPIKPVKFIDAGLKAFAKELPAAYRDLVQQYGKMGGGGSTVVRAKA